VLLASPSLVICTSTWMGHVHSVIHRLRTQDTTYVHSHPHLSTSHSVTPFTSGIFSSCLPLQIPGNETHTLLHCPYFSPLAQTAIQCLILNLRRFDLLAWATYTGCPEVFTKLCTLKQYTRYSNLSHPNLIDNIRRHGFS